MVLSVLKEVCKKFEMSKNIVIKKVKYVRKKQYYIVTLADGSERVIKQELINRYIESLGEEGALEIAGFLVYSDELGYVEPPDWTPNTEDYWEGHIEDVIDYLEKKDETQE